MNEPTSSFADELNTKSMVKLIDQLTKERDDLQNLYRNAYTLSQSCEKECNNLAKERDDLRAKLDDAYSTLDDFKCFTCGDGNTPLYCLNCANEELRAKLERAEAAAGRLVGAIRDTLNENMHLADGDVCTLLKLKQALDETNTEEK